MVLGFTDLVLLVRRSARVGLKHDFFSSLFFSWLLSVFLFYAISYSSLFCVWLFLILFKILVMWALAKCWKPILQCRFCPFLHLLTTRGSEKTDLLTASLLLIVRTKLLRGHFKREKIFVNFQFHLLAIFIRIDYI